jgi:hypothetical protein
VALADIVGDMIPYTLERYRQEALATSKKAFLDILLQCVRACRDVYGDIPKSDEGRSTFTICIYIMLTLV